MVSMVLPPGYLSVGRSITVVATLARVRSDAEKIGVLATVATRIPATVIAGPILSRLATISENNPVGVKIICQHPRSDQQGKERCRREEQETKKGWQRSDLPDS